MNSIFYTSDFYLPCVPKDKIVVSLYKKYGLKLEPSQAEIEPIAKKLLSNSDTVLEAAGLIFGREVYLDEIKIIDYLFPYAILDDRYKILLMIKTKEDLRQRLALTKNHISKNSEKVSYILE